LHDDGLRLLFKKGRKGPAYREKEKEWWTSGGGNIETQGKGLLYTFCEGVATRRMEGQPQPHVHTACVEEVCFIFVVKQWQ
jgi:hypothetical protein